MVVRTSAGGDFTSSHARQPPTLPAGYSSVPASCAAVAYPRRAPCMGPETAVTISPSSGEAAHPLQAAPTGKAGGAPQWPFSAAPERDREMPPPGLPAARSSHRVSKSPAPHDGPAWGSAGKTPEPLRTWESPPSHGDHAARGRDRRKGDQPALYQPHSQQQQQPHRRQTPPLLEKEPADHARSQGDEVGLEPGTFKDCTLSCKCHQREGRPSAEMPTAHKVKYIGVRMRGRQRWVAEIKDNNHNVRKWLGTFGCPVQAAQAFDAAARAIRGPHTRANFKMGDPDYVASIADLPKEMLTEPLASLVQAFSAVQGGGGDTADKDVDVVVDVDVGEGGKAPSPGNHGALLVLAEQSPQEGHCCNEGEQVSGGQRGAVPPSHPSVGSCLTRVSTERLPSSSSRRQPKGSNKSSQSEGGNRGNLVICYPLLSGSVAEGGQVRELSVVPLSPELKGLPGVVPLEARQGDWANHTSLQRSSSEAAEMTLRQPTRIPFSASSTGPEGSPLHLALDGGQIPSDHKDKSKADLTSGAAKQEGNILSVASKRSSPDVKLDTSPNCSPAASGERAWSKDIVPCGDDSSTSSGSCVVVGPTVPAGRPALPSGPDAGAPLVFSALWHKAEHGTEPTKRSRIRGIGSDGEDGAADSARCEVNGGAEASPEDLDQGPMKRLKVHGLSPEDACLQPAVVRVARLLEDKFSKEVWTGLKELVCSGLADLPMPVLEAIVDGSGPRSPSGTWLAL